jgi:hypothetical protein
MSNSMMMDHSYQCFMIERGMSWILTLNVYDTSSNPQECRRITCPIEDAGMSIITTKINYIHLLVTALH